MSDRLVLFVHGLGGNASRTWGDFESLLRKDNDLAPIEVGHFAYPTFIFRLPFGHKYPSIQTLAEGLSTQIENRYAAFNDITLVCHSLGGLIGKQYLVDCYACQKVHRVKRALFYTVPNNGAALASVAKFISWRHPQLKQLCRDSDAVRNIAQAWGRYRVGSILDVRYVVGAQDKVVDEHSARECWSNERVDILVDRGHIDSVKPRSADDMSYLILRNQLLKPKTLPKPGHVITHLQSVSGGAHDDVNIASQRPCESTEVRISTSAILRIELDGRYLLVRNLHRPETFAPFGGVYKSFLEAKRNLDSFSFRREIVDSDMRGDIRGYIATDSLARFKEWFSSEIERESASDCLRRELREELTDVGLSDTLIPTGLRFQHIRTVEEGPEFIPSLGCKQFRVFDVYEIVEESRESQQLVQTLFENANSSSDLVLVDAESAKRGRASSGQVVGAHTPYLFGTRRYRDGDPLFAVK